MSYQRVGVGRDIHRLFQGKQLVLGGVLVPAPFGFDTHSDGDVLCHAVIDALAGAAAMGDLGVHFPENDPETVDARSLDFVRQFRDLLASRSISISNVDAFIVLGKPRLRPFLDQMRLNLAEALSTSLENVSVKSRSNDGIGPEGTGEAASAVAVVLIEVNEGIDGKRIE